MAACRSLLACVVLLTTVSFSSQAFAEWDVKRFVTLRDEAQNLYDTAAYSDALARYLMLRSMIGNALEAGEIPDAQSALAKEALEVVHYQIGRCQQLNGACDEAYEEYQALRAATSSNEVVAKLQARLSEVLLCQARAAADKGDLAKAIGLMQHSVRVLNEPLANGEGLSEQTKATIAQVAKETRVGAEAVRDELFAKLVASAAVAVSRSDCEQAVQKEVLASTIAEARHADGIADIRDAIARSCEKKDEQVVVAPPLPPEPRPLPVAAMTLTAVGGAILLGDVVYELAYVSPTLDDYDNARADCVSAGLSCDDALALEDDLGTSKVVTLTMLGVGGAALIGGATWWLIDAFGDEQETPSAVGYVWPSADGVRAGVAWTW